MKKVGDKKQMNKLKLGKLCVQVHIGWMDGWMERRMEKFSDKWTERWVNE